MGMGAGNSEEILIQADGSQAKREIASVNKDLEGMGNTVVRISDRSKNSLDRLVTSMVRQAETYGKTGVDKLIAQRDSLISRYGGEQRAVEAITRSYNQMITVERQMVEAKNREDEAARRAIETKKREVDAERTLAKERAESMRLINASAEGQQSHFTPRYAMLAAKDVFEGRGTFAAAEGLNLLQGLKGAPLLVGGTAAALGAFAMAAKSSASSLGDFGLEMQNLHLRTGLAVSDLNQFAYAAKAVGQDSSIYERMMRGLSQALGENSTEGEKARQTLQRLGVQTRDVLTGDLKEPTDVLLNLSHALNQLPVGYERDAAAMDLFKRAGIEAIPVIQGLEEHFNRANELHLGIKDEDLKRWGEYHRILEEADARWQLLKRSFMEPLAATFNITLKAGGKVIDSLESLQYLLPGVNKPGNTEWSPKASDLNIPAGMPYDVALEHWRKGDLSTFAKEYPQRVAERRGADDFIRSRSSARTPEEQLRSAESELSKLASPVLGVSSQADAKTYYAAQDKVKGLKEQIKYTNELTEASKRLRSFENSMNQRELSPVARLKEQLNDFLTPREGQPAYSQKQINAATTVTNAAIGREMQKQAEALRAEFEKISVESSHELQEGTVKSMEETFKWLNDSTKQVLEKGLADYRKTVESIKEKDKSTLDIFSAGASHEGRMVSISSRKEGIGGELQAAQVALDVKRQIRDFEMATIKAHADVYDIDKERARIELEGVKDRYEMEEKILELKKREFDEVKSSTEKLVNTLFTKPGSFSKELGDTVKAAMLKPITSGISSTIAGAITPVIFGKNGQGGISGAMNGIFGGKQRDPMTVATDYNSTVTAQNTAAIAGLTLALAGRSAWSPSMGGPNTSSVMFGGAGGSGFSMPSFGGGSPGSFGESAGIPYGLGGSGSSGGGLGGSGTGGGGFGGFGNILSSLKGTNWGGFDRQGPGIPGEDGQPGIDTGGAGKITGVNGMAGSLLVAGGAMLAQRGLLGADRGTWKGVAEGTAGGAAIGMKYGGPMGALIGGAVGLGIGLGEHFAGVESPENEAKRLVRQVYGLNIDSKMAQQIVQVAQQKYANHVSLAVRDPDIRQMLQVFAAGTGQKIPLSNSTPYAGSLSQQGGRVSQDPTYMFGQAYSFQSNLPVAGGLSTQGLPSSPSQVVLNLNGQAAADLLEGRIANTVTPGYVQSQYASSLSASNGRTSNSATIQQPGLITS